MNKITMQEIRERGLDDDVQCTVSILTGEILPKNILQQVPMADLTLFGFGPPCPCGERGMIPGEELVEDGAGDEVCAECAAAYVSA